MMKQPVEYLMNLAMIAACIAIVAHVGLTQYQRYQNRPAPPYQPGDSIGDSDELNLQQAELTVLVGTVSACPYCQESMPFYARLQEVAAKHDVRVVAYTSEDLERNRQFFQENGVSVDAVISARENAINLRATPSVVLVRRDGTVVESWRGVLSRRDEDRLLDMITRG